MLRPGQKWPGFSFALHLLRVQGFYFTRRRISRIQAFTACFVPFMQFIQPTLQNSAQGFAGAFPAICPILPSQIPDRHKRIKCSLRHVGAYHSAATPPAYNQMPDATPGQCTAQHSRSIIIMYIKGCSGAPYYGSMPDGAAHRRPCQPGGVSMLPRPAAGGLAPGQLSGRAVWHPPPGGTARRQGVRRAARNHWRLPPQLFSGCRPIANKGEQ